MFREIVREPIENWSKSITGSQVELHDLEDANAPSGCYRVAAQVDEVEMQTLETAELQIFVAFAEHQPDICG
jgi:hypothetical protein